MVLGTRLQGYDVTSRAFGQMDFRFLISVFGNQKTPAINFWLLIHEIQKTDWRQSFLIQLLSQMIRGKAIMLITFQETLLSHFMNYLKTNKKR